MSNDVIRFRNTEGIEIVKSTVNDHRATECVERTIGSLKNKILTYAKEENPEALGNMLERALSVNATAKLTTLEAHHGREANTVLRNLTKKPSLQLLNWSKVLREKSSCLVDPMVQDLRHQADTNWGVRLDLVYDIKSRSHPRKLTEEQQLDQQDEPRIHKPDRADLTPGPSGQLYQRTGDRNLQSYRKISSKVKSTCNHKIILNNGVLLRKSAITVSRKPAKKVPASFPQTPTLKAIKQKELAIKKTKTDTVKSTTRTLKKSAASRLFQKVCELKSGATRTGGTISTGGTVNNANGLTTLQIPTDLVESEPKDNAVAESEKIMAKRGQTKEDDTKTATKKRDRRQRLASDGSLDSNDSGEKLHLGRAGGSELRSHKWAVMIDNITKKSNVGKKNEDGSRIIENLIFVSTF